MRITASLLAGSLLATATLAGPLKMDQVPADAKWVLHLDIENALRTHLGAYVGREILDPQLTRPLARLKRQTGIELDWRKIQSLTAFGTDYQARADDQGVLVIRSTLDLPTYLDQVMAKVDEVAGPGAGLLEKSQENQTTIYTLRQEIHGAAARNGAFAVSKSRAQLLRALGVLEGRAAHLGSTKTFQDFPPAPPSFFFLGLAEGFSRAGGLPPQARVLQSATGGRLTLGESNSQVLVNLVLGAQDAEATVQIQQVLQGLLALAALSQPDNPDLQRLTQATQITTQNQWVTAKVAWPATNLTARLGEQWKRRAPNSNR